MPTSLEKQRYHVVPGGSWGTPKEIWGFRISGGRGGPVLRARRFLKAHASLLGLAGIAGTLGLRRHIESLGAAHLIFQQVHRGLRINRAYVTVHQDRRGRIYLVKNRAVPRERLPSSVTFRITSAAARRIALKRVDRRRGAISVLGLERLWFPRAGRLRPAIRVRVHQERPRAEWIIHIDGVTGRMLRKYDNLAQLTGHARIFDPNPVIALGDWRGLVDGSKPRVPPAQAYTNVRLDGLRGNGYLDGRRVSTRHTPARIRRWNHQFNFRSSEPGFEEVMSYFHLNRAIAYLERLGYRGRRRVFSCPIEINARGTRDDNSWYSPGLGTLTFGTGGTDDAEDAEVILHEFGHALQDAICPDFGQSAEAAAMGEGFADYLAASFFAKQKPWKYRACVASWDAIGHGGDPPALRRLDEPLTYESFDHTPDADEHENGVIWGSVLWDIWRRLGRNTADRLIIESHFQLDGFTTFARGARAIIDADYNVDAGRHVRTLRHIFRARGIGPVE
jgi:Fungalysin metallopeptidase (M36)/Fungalysin/Thermolysin Propeptide Motif